jgi:hypothetical protein
MSVQEDDQVEVRCVQFGQFSQIVDVSMVYPELIRYHPPPSLNFTSPNPDASHPTSHVSDHST